MLNRVSQEKKISSDPETIYAQLDTLIHRALYDNSRKIKDPHLRAAINNTTYVKALVYADTDFYDLYVTEIPIDQRCLGLNYIINDINACANGLSEYTRLKEEEISKLAYIHWDFFLYPECPSYMPILRFFNRSTEQKERVQWMQEIFEDKFEQIKSLCAEYHAVKNIKTDVLTHSLK